MKNFISISGYLNNDFGIFKSSLSDVIDLTPLDDLLIIPEIVAQLSSDKVIIQHEDSIFLKENNNVFLLNKDGGDMVIYSLIAIKDDELDEKEIVSFVREEVSKFKDQYHLKYIQGTQQNIGPLQQLTNDWTNQVEILENTIEQTKFYPPVTRDMLNDIENLELNFYTLDVDQNQLFLSIFENIFDSIKPSEHLVEFNRLRLLNLYREINNRYFRANDNRTRTISKITFGGRKERGYSFYTRAGFAFYMTIGDKGIFITINLNEARDVTRLARLAEICGTEKVHAIQFTESSFAEVFPLFNESNEKIVKESNGGLNFVQQSLINKLDEIRNLIIEPVDVVTPLGNIDLISDKLLDVLSVIEAAQGRARVIRESDSVLNERINRLNRPVGLGSSDDDNYDDRDSRRHQRGDIGCYERDRRDSRRNSRRG